MPIAQALLNAVRPVVKHSPVLLQVVQQLLTVQPLAVLQPDAPQRAVLRSHNSLTSGLICD